MATAQTLVEFNAMPRPQQDEAIRVVVERVVATFTNPKDTEGRANAPRQLAVDRRGANFARALMTPETPQKGAAQPRKPYGVGLVRAMARRDAAKHPTRTIAAVVGDALSRAYDRVQHPAWLDERDDSYQESYYRLNLEIVVTKAKTNELDKRLARQSEAIEKKLDEIRESAIVLADGRRVLPDENGEFRVITRDGADGGILTGEAKREAQRIVACWEAGRPPSQCR